MTRILQITDLHLVSPGLRVSGVLDTAKLVKDFVDRLVETMPRIGPVDAVLVTGDISDDGSAESYALFRKMMAPLGLPLLVIPGNHDLREPMRQAHVDLGLLPATGKLNWSTMIGDLKVIGLDTLIEGSGGGALDGDTLAFLEAELVGTGPALVAMHHPPFACGIRFMDGIGLAGAGQLAALLARSPADVRIVCGHLHLTATGSVGHVPALVCPSPCSVFRPDFRDDAPVGFFTGGGGFMIHDWAGGFRSMNVPTTVGVGPFPF
jgi:Icc protein